MKLKIITFFLLLTSAYFSHAELESISDQELGAQYGQALLRLDETKGVAQPDGTALDFTKLTLGLKIEQNATIDKISAGRYSRPDGGRGAYGGPESTTCINEGRICYYDQLNPWNCSTTTCGGLDGTFAVSATTYGTVFDGLTLLDKKQFSTFQSGFDPSNDRGNADVIIRDATVGYVNDTTGELYDAVMENPYIELAYHEDKGIRSIEGFRLGFEKQNGTMGAALDVFSGFLISHTVIGLDVVIPLLGNIHAADINVDAWVGGVRTAGYLDPNKTVVNSCIGLACSGPLTVIIHPLVGGDPSTPAGIADGSPDAQLFPLQNASMVNAQGFFFSMQKKPVQWPDLPTGTPEVALPGVWLNVGGGNNGLQASNSKSWHPDNYFPGHPLDSVYLPSNNTKNGYY